MDLLQRGTLLACLLVFLLVAAACGGSGPGQTGVILPSTEDDTPLLLTEQSRPDRWEARLALIAIPTAEGFLANVRPMTDAALDGLTAEGIRELPREADASTFVLVADARALTDDGFPILIVDVSGERLPSFRVTAACLWAVENNLAIANVDWEELLAATVDGVLRDC